MSEYRKAELDAFYRNIYFTALSKRFYDVEAALVDPCAIDRVPLRNEFVQDLGDIVPFVDFLPEGRALVETLDVRNFHGADGLPVAAEDFSLLEYHDYLLGLVFMARRGNLAAQDSFDRVYDVILTRHETPDGLLTDRVRKPWPMVNRCSAFNLGYVELLADMHRQTGRAAYLAQAAKLAEPWLDRIDTQAAFAFRQRFWPWDGLLEMVRAQLLRRSGLQLFKDMVMAGWAMLALARASDEPRCGRAVQRVVRELESLGAAGGLLPQHPEERQTASVYPTAYAADLLLDIGRLYPNPQGAFALAEELIERVLAVAEDDGQIVTDVIAHTTHADATIDFGVVLWKAGQQLGKPVYLQRAYDVWVTALKKHFLDDGLVISLDAQGRVRMPEKKLKYQFLALKPWFCLQHDIVGGSYEELMFRIRDR